jgi:SAM-dependent methyltransferase
MKSAESDMGDDLQRARKAITSGFLKGNGLEVGAGHRPFRVPDHVRIRYGDIRDRESLESYFKNSEVKTGDKIDAQTFAGLEACSFDFVILAHVIEHLRDPVGSIMHAVRILKPGAVLILVVPDLLCTFDRNRPETTVEHALRDYQDGGESTTRLGYEEHLRYVIPTLPVNIIRKMKSSDKPQNLSNAGANSTCIFTHGRATVLRCSSQLWQS